MSESIYLWYGDGSFPRATAQTKHFLSFGVNAAIFVGDTGADTGND